MKKRLHLATIAIMVLTAVSTYGIDTSRPVAERIGILRTPPPRVLGVEKTVRKYLPRYLEASLSAAGFEVRMIDRTIDQMTDGTDDDILIDIGFADERGEPLSSVGAGATIEGVGVGGEVSVIEAAAVAEIRVYHAKTLEPLTSMELDAEKTGAALTSIGLGDPYGWIQFRIPITSKGPLKQVAREIADDAATLIQEQFGK